jgi:hypothetical protein
MRGGGVGTPIRGRAQVRRGPEELWTSLQQKLLRGNARAGAQRPTPRAWVGELRQRGGGPNCDTNPMSPKKKDIAWDLGGHTRARAAM